MLTNNELKQIKKAYTLLASLRRGFISADETNLLYEIGEGLKQIYETHSEKKQKASDKVAQYHKDNAEKHREYNREWERQKRAKLKKEVK